MQHLVSGMAAITEATVSPEKAPKISVADTLEHARRTLSTHREWLQRRLSPPNGDEVGAEESNTPETRGERWVVADVENDNDEETGKILEQRNSALAPNPAPAPPSFVRQSDIEKKRRKTTSSRVAPAPLLDILTEEEEKQIPADPHWATSSAEPGIRSSEPKTPGEDEDTSTPNSKRQKIRWSAVFPATSSPSSDTTAPPPVHLFTSKSSVPTPVTPPPEPLFSPSLTVLQNPLTAWGSLSSLDNYMESLETEEQSREPEAEATSDCHTGALEAATEGSVRIANPRAVEPENTGKSALSPTEGVEQNNAQDTVEPAPVSGETDPVEQERSRPEMADILELQSESTATILAVGPAPRDRQSSYEVHHVSKLDEAGRGVRMVKLREKESTELDSGSDIRITPGEKVATNKTPTISETGAVEDVLPYQGVEESSSTDDSPDQGAHLTTETEFVYSDDEVFESQTGALFQPQKVSEVENKVERLPGASKSDESFPSQVQVGTNSYGGAEGIQDTAESVRLTEKGERILQANDGDLSFRPCVTSTPTIAAALQGATGVREGGSADNRQQILEKLNLPQLNDNSEAYTLFIPELKLLRKRAGELPSYSTHHQGSNQSGLALSPPCPQYGVKQPDITPDSFLQRKRLSSAPANHPSLSSPPPAISEHVDGWSWSRTPPMMSSGIKQSGQGHPRLRHTMSSPEGGGEGGGAIRRVSSVPESPLLQSRGVGALDAASSGSTTSLYQMMTGPSPLHLAAKCGNGRQIQQLMSDGENINARDHDGRTPLMYCIHSRGVHLSCASLLVQAGAALDKQASDGSTALHLASATGGVSLIEFALLNHADPDVRDFEGRLPLHWATLTRQSSKCAALLLKHSKLDINAVDDAGMTPLMWAAYNNNPLVTEFLLSQGADCEEKDRDGMTAMHWAIHQDGVRCLELLLKADHTYFKDHRGRTVLHLSAEAGCLSACQLILRLRADAVHDLDRMGRTPLHYASACSRVDLCALLLDRGSDAAHRDLTGKTAVEYARLKRFDYVVALLTCHGTSVADFARTSRSTSVSSLLNRAKSFSDLATSGDVPVNQDIITESLHRVSSSSDGERGGEGVDTSALTNGAFLGRFIDDKNDPVQHFFFWVDPSTSKLHWSRKTDRRRAQEATVFTVHNGPSKHLHQNPAYSPSELHQHVFWLKTDSGVFDLFAYNDPSYQNWVGGLGEIARGAPPDRDLGAENHSGADNRVSSARRIEAKKYWLKGKRSSAVVPALVIDNESVGRSPREGWQGEGRGEDSEIELQTMPTMETTDESISQGSPHYEIDDII